MRFFVLTLLALISLSSCMPKNTIKRLYFDKEKHCYIAEMNKKRVPYIVRDHKGRIVQDKASLKTMMTNRKLPDHIIKINRNYIERTDAYRCGKQYAAGLREAKTGRFEKALTHFQNALKKFPKVIRISDVHYLMAFCHLSLGNKKEGIKHLELFLRFSRQILPAVFNTDVKINQQAILPIKAARAFLTALKKGEKINPGKMIAYHDKIPEPALDIDLFAEGYTIRSNNRNRKKISYYAGIGKFSAPSKSRQKGTYGAGCIYSPHKNLDIVPLFSLSTNVYIGSVDIFYQIYRSKNNRFGILLSSDLSYLMKDEKGYNINSGIVVTGFPLLSLQLYGGIHARVTGDDFYFHPTAWTVNYSNDRIRYKIGINWYFYSAFNLKAEYDTKKFFMGLAIGRIMSAGYNFSDKELFVQYMKYRF